MSIRRVTAQRGAPAESIAIAKTALNAYMTVIRDFA
jgi:hypothetical protein